MDGKQAPDVSNYEESKDLWLILAAILLIDVIVIIIARFTGLFGSIINTWYDKFGLNAVLADVLIIFLGFLVARWIYTKYVKPRYGWDAWMFTGLMILVQLVHDTLFYFGVIKPIARGDNKMIDVFKDYAEAGGWKILVADASMMAGSAAVAMAYKAASPATVAAVTGLAAYSVPYLLYAKPIEPVIGMVGGSSEQ
jgi:hypothetical protein